MTVKRFALLLCAALAGALLPLLSPLQAAQALSRPLESAGEYLRALSLSGTAGNVLAWALVLLVSALPLLLLALLRRRGPLHWEDGLLPLASLLLFILSYFTVNPTHIPVSFAAQVWLMAFFMVTAADLIVWGILRLLRAMEGSPLQTLSRVLGVLLTACAVLLVFSAALRGTRALAAAVEGPAPEQLAIGQLIAGGPFDLVMSSGSQWLAAILTLAELVPDLLGAWVLLLGADLTAALAQGPFSGESAVQCAAAARRCRLAIQITLVLTLAVSLVKLTLFGQVEMVQVSLNFPLIPLILAAALYLLCRCLQRGKVLQDDNDSII